MIVSSITDKGLIRESNQDFFFVSDNKKVPLFIVADGMGGHKAGEIASKMAVEIIVDDFFSDVSLLNSEERIINKIKSSIARANELIYKKSKATIDCEGMGTTITMAYIFNEHIFLGHVGDSRGYLVTTDLINQITEDHSLVNELIKNGSITKEEGKSHPQKNLITRAVGTETDIEIDVYIEKYHKEDTLILCTDGLTNLVDENTILNEIIKVKDIFKVGRNLTEKARNNGGYDNITIILIKFLENEVIK